MPIPGGSSGVLTPPITPPVYVGAYDFRLLRPDSLFVLNGAVGIEVQAGAQGLDDPTLDFTAHTPAGWDGDLVDSIQAEPREVFLPLLMRAPTLMDLRALKQSLLTFVNPRRGTVILRVGLPDGSGRLIDGYYAGGLGPTMDADSWGVSWQKVGLTLRCSVPFWRSEKDWSVTWSTAVSNSSPLPILPVQPARPSVIPGTNNVEIHGDVETYPIWTLTGPLTSVTFLDVAAGRTFTFTAAVADGDEWIIDTRRGIQGVFDPSGVRQRATLNPGADLFPLQPGISAIEISATGTGTNTSINGQAPELWLAA